MGTAALNLAFDNDRAVIQTVGDLDQISEGETIRLLDTVLHSNQVHGIFVLNLRTKAPYEVIKLRDHPSQLLPQPAILPNLSAHQLLHFRNPLPLRLISCLKLSRTAVWLDWSTRALEEVEGRVAPLAEEDEGMGMDADAVREEHPYGELLFFLHYQYIRVVAI